MADSRKTSKRQKCFGVPIEVCVKYERKVGVKPGDEPTKKQAEAACKLMVDALTLGVSDVVLTSKDFEQIAKEVARNEANR